MNGYTLYMALNGKDIWSGHYPSPLPDGSDGPLQSFYAVKEQLRNLKNHGGLPSCSVNVYLREGVYRLNEPIILEPKDSGNITITAYEGEKVIISGGRSLLNWKETEVNGKTAWVTFLPEVMAGKWYFKSLYVNGSRRARSRYPKDSYLWIEDVPGVPLVAGLLDGSDVFKCADGDIQNWKNLNDAEAVVMHWWVEERMPITGYDSATKLLYSSRRSIFHLRDDLYERYAKYYIENIIEAMSEPGEWYLDRTTGMLYYIPLPDEEMNECMIEAPVATELLVFAGNPEKCDYVENLTVSGIEFTCTDWEYSQELPQQMAHMRFDPEVKFAAAPQAGYNITAAVTMRGAKYCSIENCRFSCMGHYGIEIGTGSKYNRISRNKITECGGGGIKITGGDAFQPAYCQTGCNRVEDNLIKNCGQVFFSSVGIGVFDSFGNSISHNEICNLPYSGISCGWVWGYGESNTHDNTIAENHIHHLGTGTMSDLGGIYLLGRQPGTVVCGNLIHDIQKANYGGWGLYLDEGCSFIIIENNIVYNTSSQCLNLHFGKENMVRNNIFAFGKEGIVGMGRIQNHIQSTFIRNIFITDGVPVFVNTMDNCLSKCGIITDCNVFWDKHGSIIPGGKINMGEQSEGVVFKKWIEFDHWYRFFYDLHSIVANPCCKDMDEGDFTVAESSPAIKQGFVAFNTDHIGVRKYN